MTTIVYAAAALIGSGTTGAIFVVGGWGWLALAAAPFGGSAFAMALAGLLICLRSDAPYEPEEM